MKNGARVGSIPSILAIAYLPFSQVRCECQGRGSFPDGTRSAEVLKVLKNGSMSTVWDSSGAASRARQLQRRFPAAGPLASPRIGSRGVRLAPADDLTLP